MLARAADVLLGDHLTWEPESTWLELERQGVHLSTTARDKLMAVTTLLLVPAFYWDAVVFSKTCVAFDGRPAHVSILEEATPAAMAWAVEEAAWIRSRHADQVLTCEHEVIAYTGVVLRRAGLVLAPRQLSFAQGVLDRGAPGHELARAVKARWESLDKSQEALTRLSLQETPLDVQVARLAAAELHVQARRGLATDLLARLA